MTADRRSSFDHSARYMLSLYQQNNDQQKRPIRPTPPPPRDGDGAKTVLGGDLPTSKTSSMYAPIWRARRVLGLGLVCPAAAGTTPCTSPPPTILTMPTEKVAVYAHNSKRGKSQQRNSKNNKNQIQAAKEQCTFTHCTKRSAKSAKR